MQDTTKKQPSGVEGEGSYSASRDYDEATARFIAKGKVDKAAKDAARALDSTEKAELEAAEAKGKAKAKK